MQDEIKVMFDYTAIGAEPIYVLEECVAALPDSVDDDCEDVTEPVCEIKERFRKCLYLCNEEKLEFVRFAAELSAKKAVWNEKISYHPFNVFHSNGFVYLFSNDDKYYLALPDELAEIYREVTAEENFAVVNANNLELSTYANALLNLYGAYEIEQFVNVWNHHHKNKITYTEAETFLSDMAYFHSDYYFDEDFVVHDCMFIDDFDSLLDEVYDKEYYMPTKSVIREYANKGYELEFEIPCEKEMAEFLANYITDERELDDVSWDIMTSCERLRSPAEVRQILEKAGIPLEDESFVERFERLYQNLRDNTHIWELRGFTPYRYMDETGEIIQRFKLPEVKTNKKAERKYEHKS